MRRYMLLTCLSVVGCGPLSTPMVHRLDDEQQQVFDETWVNAMSPPSRLERTLLLDVMITRQLHQLGVDHLRMVSEKRVGDGLVVMEIRFDRDDPVYDEFVVTYLDREGREVRRERYCYEEIEARVEFFYGPQASGRPADEITPEEKRRFDRQAAEREVRLAEIEAAIGPPDADSGR